MTGRTSEGGRELHGQWAVVTGASKGIGQAIAERFVMGGANVIMVARAQEALDDAVTMARKHAGDDQEVVGLVADVADRGSLSQLFDHVRTRVPALNVF